MTIFSPLLLIVTFQEMTIKHIMYTPKVPFLYTERACVLFFQFWNSPRKISYVNRSVATGPLPELCITFHLHYISFVLHLKNLPHQHKMPATSRFKCHVLHLHFMK